jgi:hypothetical protein
MATPKRGVRAPAPPPPPKPTAKPTAKARKLARELHEMQLEARVMRAKAGLRRLKESAAFDYDWVGPWQALLQQRDGDPGWLPIGSSSARRHGTNFPFYQTEQQLSLLRDLSRIVVGTNNNAAGILRGYTAFVIGTGYATKVSVRPGTGDAGKAADARVTAFLDRWAALNNWSERQQEVGRRTERDGDGVLRLFADDGWLKARHVWPEQLTQPPGTSFEEYGFGIRWRTREDGSQDCEEIESVYVADANDPARGDEVAPEDVVLFQPENDAGVKRRVPLFAFGMREVLDTAGRLTRNLGEGSAVRAAIAYMRKHEAAGQSDVEAMNFADADFRERAPRGDTYRPVSQSYPGMVIDFGEGMEHVPKPVDSEVSANSAVVDLLVRSACARINAPEWLGSSNAANMGAYTSSLVAESPFVKGVIATQGYYKARFLRVIRRALEVAAAHGVIGRADLDLVTVDLVPPSPEVRNKLEESQRAAVEIPLGVDSRQRYCESQDRDYEKIAEENKQYADENGPPNTPLPDEPPPGSSGGGGAGARTPDGGLAEQLLESEETPDRVTAEEWLDLVEGGRVLLEAKSGSGLVPKKITVTTAKGTSYQKTVMVKPDQAKAAKPDPKADKLKAVAAAQKAVADALADPASADLASLADHLKNLPAPALKGLKAQAGVKGGTTKAQIADKLIAHIKAKAEPPPAPLPAKLSKADKKAAAQTAVAAAYGDPGKADLAALADHLKDLTVPELQAVVKAQGMWAPAGGAKQKKIDKILSHLKAKQWAASVAPAASTGAAGVAAAPVAAKKPAGKADKADVEAHVAGYLKKTNKTAGQLIASGEFSKVAAALKGLGYLDSSVGHFEVKYALDNLEAQQTEALLPPKFAKGGAANKPNKDLPNESRPKLETAEAVAAQKYTSSAYAPINSQLRTSDSVPKQYEKTHEELQKAFAKAKPFPAPVTVKRGLTLSGPALEAFVAAAQHAKDGGHTATMPGYLSTSVSSSTIGAFSGSVELTIQATHGLDLLPYTHYPHEKELLLNHGSRFKVAKVENVGGKWQIELEQIPPGAGEGAKLSIDSKFKAASKTSGPIPSSAKVGGPAPVSAPAPTPTPTLAPKTGPPTKTPAKKKQGWVSWLTGN